MLPSGNWAAHDPEYYQKFYKKWQAEYNAHVRMLEKKAVKGFEGADTDDTQEVDAAKEMEKAKREIKEREDKKALTEGDKGAPHAPRMNVQVCVFKLRSCISMLREPTGCEAGW